MNIMMRMILRMNRILNFIGSISVIENCNNTNILKKKINTHTLNY